MSWNDHVRAWRDYLRHADTGREKTMVLPPQKMSEEIASKAAAEQVKRMLAEGKTADAVIRINMRQWCIEKAVQVCGQEGVVWIGQHGAGRWTDYSNRGEGGGLAELVDKASGPPPDVTLKSAVVPIAREIFAFVMGENDNGSVQG